jgi:peptidoglycan/xylan/chitin deacetylase (PgdA/CDA1 family)
MSTTARLGTIAAAAAVPAALHMLPSVVSLGQWVPLRSLPGDLCRWRGPAGDRVALTFDDGPDPESTPLLLERLDQLGLVATFFCVGSLVQQHPEVVAEVRKGGHQIAVHGHRHEHHFARTPGWVGGDLDAALEALAGTGVRPRWFRPPYGQTPGATLWQARRRGLQLVLWSAWGREWVEGDAAAVARRVNRHLGGGAIVLLHDADTFSPPGSAARAREALGPIAEELRRRGLQAVTLDELVGAA